MANDKPSFRYNPDDAEGVGVELDPRVIVLASVGLVVTAGVLAMAMNGWAIPL